MYRMSFAMVDDFRCVIIKPAERITFLRNAENHFGEATKKYYHKNVPIFMPHYVRLGIGQLEMGADDYCFRYLQHPEQYRNITNIT